MEEEKSRKRKKNIENKENKKLRNLNTFNNSGQHHTNYNQGAQIEQQQYVEGDQHFYFLSPKPPVDFKSFVLPPVVEMVGREKEMEDLKQLFEDNKQVAIVGLGGVGKTTLAYNYAKQWKDENKIVLVINSETEETIQESIKRFGAKSNLEKYHELPDILLEKILRLITDNGNEILLIYDNVKFRTEIQKYLSKSLENMYILLTSQNQDFDKFGKLPLNTLKKTNSLKLLESKIDIALRDTEQKIKEELIQKLENLPLAIVQAVASINYQAVKVDPKYTVGHYLKEYKKILLNPSCKEPFSDNTEDPYNKTVYIAIKMNIKLMKNYGYLPDEITKGTLNILYLSSFLNPDYIESDLFITILSINNEQLNNMIRLLAKFSLCERKGTLFPTNKILTIHRLVLKISRIFLKRYIKKDYKEIIMKTIINTKNFNMHEKYLLPYMELGSFYKSCEAILQDNWTVYQCAAYLGASQLFSNIQISNENSMSFQKIYEQQKTLLIKNLDSKKYNISSDDGTELMKIADSNWKYECVIKLLENGASAAPVVNILYFAVRKDDVDTVKKLLDRGADVNIKNGDQTHLFSAVRCHKWKCMLELLKNNADTDISNNEKRTPLFEAAARGSQYAVKILLKYKANTEISDNKGWTPLHAAARWGHEKCVTLLLDNNAKINKPDDEGRTPLNTASKWGKVECARILLDNNAEINKPDNDGRTPLNGASKWGQIDCVRVLLDKDANINKPDNDQRTPLNHAIYWKRNECVELLLEHGADINIADVNGLTPEKTSALRHNTHAYNFLKNLLT